MTACISLYHQVDLFFYQRQNICRFLVLSGFKTIVFAHNFMLVAGTSDSPSPKPQITFHWNGLVENLGLFSPKCTVMCELPYLLYTVYCPFMTLRLIFYHYFVSFSLFSLSLSVVSINYIHKKNNKIINAEKFCSNKCSLYKPTMGKIEGVFLLCFFKKEAFSGTSWTLSQLEDRCH